MNMGVQQMTGARTPVVAVVGAVMLMVGVMVGVAAGCSQSGKKDHGARGAAGGGSGGVMTAPGAAMTKEEALNVLRGEWELTHLDGTAMELTNDMIERGRGPTLEVRMDEKGEVRAAGVGGINRWSGVVKAEELGKGRLIVGPVVATKMAGPVDSMTVETQYFAALERVRNFDAARAAQGVLLLSDEKGTELVRMKRR